ncbi:tetratricopeptide repeat protein [Anaerosphaera multitolerans]|uniref:Tetratricopeptide repeat protein n=1 Tax=Anaerosphaera multitolerans TaxID=2487351 RepID=A0A437S708_9FIRM|nr:hypothetical protein [Anaerosphaera multitolerans]RVU54738.1 hypothetical protein EF514_05300 [Anaerosphaera multitolerans]
MNLEMEIQEKLKNIVFLELKKDTEIANFKIDRDLPLPMNLNNLVEGIRTSEFEEEISIEKINQGIIYLLGIDGEFKYREKYIEILNHSIRDLKNYVIYLSSKSVENNELIDGYIYLNGLSSIIGEDNEIKFMKTNILENIYNRYFNEIEEKDKEKMINNIVKSYEQIISKDEEYYLAYYRLGYIFRDLKKYLKSKLYFEKFLNSESDYEDLKTEVREVLMELEDYANVEIAETYISYGKFQDAYGVLQNVSGLYPEQSLLYYYFSLSQYNLGFINEALESIDIAISLDDREEQFYNQKGMCYIAMDYSDEAIQTYLDGLSKVEDSYILNYNLGILLLNKKDDNYKKYLKKAYQLEPNEELLNLIE